MNYVVQFFVFILLTGCGKSPVVPIKKCQIDNQDAPNWMCELKDKNVFKSSQNNYYALGSSPDNNPKIALNSAKDKIIPEIDRVIKLELESLLKRSAEKKDIDEVRTLLFENREPLGNWTHPISHHLYTLIKVSLKDITNTTQDYCKKNISFTIKECFESGSVSVSSICKSTIKQDKFFMQNEKQYLLIEVHTDKTGDSKYNDRISKQRAIALAETLVSNYPKRTIYFAGRGKKFPIVYEETPEANSINRRSVFTYVSPKELSSYEGIVKYSKLEEEKKKSSHNVEKKSSEKENSKEVLISERTEKPTVIAPVTEAITPIVVQKKNIDRSTIDFGGSIAQHTNPGFERFLGKWDEPDKILQKRCIDTSPVQQKRENKKDHSFGDYVPGLYGATWVSKIEDHLIAIDKVAVFPNGKTIDYDPNILIYQDHYIAAKNKPTKKLKTVVNTFIGEKGVLYRIYIKGNDSLQCADIVFPLIGKNFTVKKGELYYVKNGQLYTADFMPRIIKQN